MKHQFTKRDAAIMLVCSLIVACGGRMNVPTPNPVATIKRLVSGNRSTAHIQTDSKRPMLASLFDTPLWAQTPAPPVGQSFDAICVMSLDLTTVPQGNLVVIPMGAGVNDCNSFSSSPLARIGKKIHDSGNLGTLEVDVTLTDGSVVSCSDRTDAPAVADASFAQAYLDPNKNSVIIGNDVNVTTLTCPFTVTTGTKIAQIEAQWVK